MGSLNKWIGIGRLCQDPEIREAGNGTVLNNSLAINENYKDKQGQKVERTEFIRLVCWNHTANIIHKYCQKGSQIFVEGSLQTREWQDNDGNKRYTTEINVRNVQLLDSRSSNNQDNQQGSANYHSNQNAQTQQTQGYQQNNDFMEQDVPF